jgi:DNA-binding response OmpR family regulator
MKKAMSASTESAPSNGNRTALAVCADPSALNTDRDFLRHLGYGPVRVRFSGEAGLDLATNSRFSLVLCDMELDDMRAPDFIVRLRKSAPTAPPVLALSPNGGDEDWLRCLAAGCAGFLLRPYSMDSFLRQERLARRGAADAESRRALIKQRLAAREEQGEQADPENEPRRFYLLGCRHLARRRFDRAIYCFNRAVRLQELFAEAYVGLARAWKAKGRSDKYRLYMEKAARAYALLERFHEARELFVSVLRKNPESENPFLDLGFALAGKRDFEGAASAYFQALKFHPESNIYRHMARACLFTARPEDSAQKIAEALAQKPGMPEASGIFRRAMGAPCPPRKTDTQERQSFLPDRLHEFWLVMKYVWKVYKSDGAKLAKGI